MTASMIYFSSTSTCLDIHRTAPPPPSPLVHFLLFSSRHCPVDIEHAGRDSGDMHPNSSGMCRLVHAWLPPCCTKPVLRWARKLTGSAASLTSAPSNSLARYVRHISIQYRLCADDDLLSRTSQSSGRVPDLQSLILDTLCLPSISTFRIRPPRLTHLHCARGRLDDP